MGRERKEMIEGVSAVILAGGESRRMGNNKALLPYRDGRFIDAVHRQLAAIFPEVILVTNTPELYQALPCRKVADLYPGMGALAGIHAGLHHSANPRIFVVACDMPCLNSRLIRHLAASGEGHEVVVAESDSGVEPLHALYSKESLAAIEQMLIAGEKRVTALFPKVRLLQLPAAEIALLDPAFASFRNINTPEEYARLREEEKGGAGPPGEAICR
jgi:FdhD protein